MSVEVDAVLCHVTRLMKIIARASGQYDFWFEWSAIVTILHRFHFPFRDRPLTQRLKIAQYRSSIWRPVMDNRRPNLETAIARMTSYAESCFNNIMRLRDRGCVPVRTLRPLFVYATGLWRGRMSVCLSVCHTGICHLLAAKFLVSHEGWNGHDLVGEWRHINTIRL